MFITPLLLVGLFGSISATPLSPGNVAGNNVPSNLNFNNWHGLSSLNDFDNFFGVGNFDGSHNVQTFIEKEVRVCHAQRVSIVQQRLLVLQEMAKRVVTELVCDVETQAIVFEQFHNSMRHFKDDLRRKEGRRPGFDQNVSNHFSKVIDDSGQLTIGDLGFNGQNIGTNTVVVGGTNWNDKTSPVSVADAFSAAGRASTSDFKSN